MRPGRSAKVDTSNVEFIDGLVHPFTDQIWDPEDLTRKTDKYSKVIHKVADDPRRILVFIGTMPEDTLDALRKLDDETGKRLSDNIGSLSDTGRVELRRDLKERGVTLKPDARYTILDELSLLYKSVSSIPPERLVYLQYDVNPSVVRERLLGVDTSLISVSFTGEKPDICVKERGQEVCDALEIPENRLIIQ